MRRDCFRRARSRPDSAFRCACVPRRAPRGGGPGARPASVWLAAAFVLGGLVLAGCRGDDGSATAAPEPAPATVEVTVVEPQTLVDTVALTGQLEAEIGALSHSRVYTFGPTFRAENSNTSRHLAEFWMVEPEVAFLDFEGVVQLAEDFVCYLTARVLERCREELATLERDVSKLEKITPSFPRITYGKAVEILKEKGSAITWGDDFGGEDETLLAEHFDRPVFVTRFPAAFKAFYMEPDPEDDRLVLGADLLAPEGYGEIIGGSQRIHDHDLLLRRIKEHELPIEAFQWYLDVRKYGTFPHSGFGMGIERFVAWMCGVPHLRETIPYPRMLYKIYP